MSPKHENNEIEEYKTFSLPDDIKKKRKKAASAPAAAPTEEESEEALVKKPKTKASSSVKKVLTIEMNGGVDLLPTWLDVPSWASKVAVKFEVS